jgi:hypothetical protein
MFSGDFWVYWYYHIPNYLLALVIYTLLGRFVLSFLVPEDWGNYIWRAFRRMTDPFVRATAFVTPRAVLPLFHCILAALWVMTFRVIFTVLMFQAGLTPSITGS